MKKCDNDEYTVSFDCSILPSQSFEAQFPMIECKVNESYTQQREFQGKMKELTFKVSKLKQDHIMGNFVLDNVKGKFSLRSVPAL